MNVSDSGEPLAAPTTRPRVVVVGAGIVGLCIANALTRRGASVTVLEAYYPGAGATSKSFAWLNNQAYFRNSDGITDDQAKHYFELHRQALGSWHALENRVGDVGIRWRGLLAWCRPGSEQERFEGELERRLAWGGPTRRVDMAAIERLVPGCRVANLGSAFYGTDEGCIDPTVAVSAIAGDCIAAGVDLRWPCPVTGIAFAGDRVIGLETPTGTVHGDIVVVTAGARTPALAAQVGLEVPLVESDGAIVHLAPLPMFLNPVLLSPDVHVVQRQDGRVALAQHFAGSPVDEGNFVESTELLRTAAQVLPQLEHARIERTTVGRRVLPIDGLPIIGPSQRYPNAYCVALNAGISLGALVGELVATEIVEAVDVDLLRPYRPSRFTAL
jgi:glycine/D-amino acid oxidase-like deaminating enzyme